MGNHRHIYHINVFIKIMPIFIIILFLVILELAVRNGYIKQYLFPMPSSVLINIWKDFSSYSSHIFITTTESLTGFAIASIFALILAVLFVLSQTFDRSAFPLIIAFKCMPLVALAPILALWFGGGSVMAKAIPAGFICFFPIVVNLRTGLNIVNLEAVDLFRSLSASNWVVLWKLRMPSSIPYLLSGLKTASTLAVIGAVVGEFAGSDRGLGYLIQQASYQGNTIQMFAAVTLLMILGLIFFGILSVIEYRINKFFRIDSNDNKVIS